MNLICNNLQYHPIYWQNHHIVNSIICLPIFLKCHTCKLFYRKQYMSRMKFESRTSRNFIYIIQTLYSEHIIQISRYTIIYNLELLEQYCMKITRNRWTEFNVRRIIVLLYFCLSHSVLKNGRTWYDRTLHHTDLFGLRVFPDELYSDYFYVSDNLDIADLAINKI